MTSPGRSRTVDNLLDEQFGQLQTFVCTPARHVCGTNVKVGHSRQRSTGREPKQFPDKSGLKRSWPKTVWPKTVWPKSVTTFLWAGPPPLSANLPPPVDPLRRTPPSAAPPKFSLFCSLSRHNFPSFFSLWVGSSRGILVEFLTSATLKCARVGSRVVV